MTDASRRDFLILTGAAGAGLLLAESSSRALAAANPAVTLDPVTGRTKVAAMLADAPTSGGYEIVPLVSAGDNIPLLTGTWPDLQPHPELTYGITSDPDGLGLMTVGDYHYVCFSTSWSATNPTKTSTRPSSRTPSRGWSRARA